MNQSNLSADRNGEQKRGPGGRTKKHKRGPRSNSSWDLGDFIPGRNPFSGTLSITQNCKNVWTFKLNLSDQKDVRKFAEEAAKRSGMSAEFWQKRLEDFSTARMDQIKAESATPSSFRTGGISARSSSLRSWQTATPWGPSSRRLFSSWKGFPTRNGTPNRWSWRGIEMVPGNGERSSERSRSTAGR